MRSTSTICKRICWTTPTPAEALRTRTWSSKARFSWSMSTTSVIRPKLMMHRWWSSYESMYYSHYLGTKLAHGRYKERSVLDDMIVRLGIPLIESQQKWNYLMFDLKKSFKEKLPDISDKYQLHDIIAPIFIRVSVFLIVNRHQFINFSLRYLLLHLLYSRSASSSALPLERVWRERTALLEKPGKQSRRHQGQQLLHGLLGYGPIKCWVYSHRHQSCKGVLKGSRRWGLLSHRQKRNCNLRKL